uniref:Reverse transcriptase domain-containing protein n=1 Tax=Tanacetum cinerariifolium TaxID=118510 RepID=A0A699K5I7_TANCI|nr:hypothetical protein [Tanacetum cinerariifolium]
MEVDIEEDDNEPELTYPYEEVDPLNPPSLASVLEHEDVIGFEDTVESEDETVTASVHMVGESSTAHFLREDSDGLLLGLMRRDIKSLFGQMDSLSRRLCSRETAHALVKKKGKAKDNYYGKLILDLGNKNKRVERDLYWTRVRAHEFYREIIRRGFVFEERHNEAIDVLVEDKKSPSSESRGSPRDLGFGPVKGQDTAPSVSECTFTGFMKCNPTVFHSVEGDVELRRWFEKTKSVFGISECVEGKKVKFVAATLEGPALTWWNSKIATMRLETVNQMP